MKWGLKQVKEKAIEESWTALDPQASCHQDVIGQKETIGAVWISLWIVVRQTTLPVGVLPGIPMKPPQGFKDFALADGRIIPNLGQKIVQMAFQCGLVLTGTFSVVDSAKPLLSVGKMTSLGHTVKMTPEGGQIILKNGKSIKIYYRNGVWKIPTWIWCPGDGKEDESFQRQGKP